MKRYLYHVTQGYATKNKLQKAVSEYIHNMNRFPVNEVDFPRLQCNMLLSIVSLNTQHPRCTPVEVDFRRTMTGDINVHVGGFISSSFLKFEEL